MNCIECQYLLWDLPEQRCPECARVFELSEYTYPKGAVHFVCRHCEQPYLGNDEQGLPSPRRFACLGCHRLLTTFDLRVRPITPDASAEPLRQGTSWAARDRAGFLRAFLDGMARLATEPRAYFKRLRLQQGQGALLFSVICSILTACVFLLVALLLERMGLIRIGPGVSDQFSLKVLLVIVVAVPFLQIAWDYVYGFMIYAVLRILGLKASDLDASVRAVAFGSAVLPALFLLPPLGIPWYVKTVSNGIEQFNRTSRSRALLATLIPFLAAGHLLLAIAYAAMYA